MITISTFSWITFHTPPMMLSIRLHSTIQLLSPFQILIVQSVLLPCLTFKPNQWVHVVHIHHLLPILQLFVKPLSTVVQILSLLVPRLLILLRILIIIVAHVVIIHMKKLYVFNISLLTLISLTCD